MPNTPFSVRGADTAPFRLSVNIPNVISAGVEKAGPSGVALQTLYGQPFFVQGDWDKVEGAAEGKGISVLLEKGATADDRKRAEALIAFTGAARAFYAAALGPAPDVPLRLVAVRRGAGFSDSGTVLIDADGASSEDRCRHCVVGRGSGALWIGGQAPVRGEGAGVCAMRSFVILRQSFSKSSLDQTLLNRSCTTAFGLRDGSAKRWTTRTHDSIRQHVFRVRTESWCDVLASG